VLSSRPAQLAKPSNGAVQTSTLTAGDCCCHVSALLVTDSNRCQVDLCGTIPHSVDFKACHVAHLPRILVAACLQPVSKVCVLGLSTVERPAKLIDLRSHVA